MERQFRREIQALDQVFAFVDEFAAASALDGQTLFCIRLAVEELFVNMVKYNAQGRNGLSIRLARDEGQVMATLVDPDTDPFDVTKYKEIDVTLPLEARGIGGHGIYLVRKMMDAVDYQYANRCSTIVLTKKLVGQHAKCRGDQEPGSTPFRKV